MWLLLGSLFVHSDYSQDFWKSSLALSQHYYEKLKFYDLNYNYVTFWQFVTQISGKWTKKFWYFVTLKWTNLKKVHFLLKCHKNDGKTMITWQTFPHAVSDIQIFALLWNLFMYSGWSRSLKILPRSSAHFTY